MTYNINIRLDQAQEQELVSVCTAFKKNTKDFFREKREAQRRCYAYIKSQFYGDDLMPKPAIAGQEGDSDSSQWRAGIFTPIAREIAKVLFSYMKLTLFPNDAEYFRVKGLGSAESQYEDDLTEGLKHLLQEARFTEKAGEIIWNLLWAGEAVGYPCIDEEETSQWDIIDDGNGPMYTQSVVETNYRLCLESWDPLCFYPEPFASTENLYRWGYFSSKSKAELLDDAHLLNRDKIEAQSGKSDPQQRRDSLSLNEFNKNQNVFKDSEKHFDYDLFFFPRIKLGESEYKNFIAAIVDETIVVTFRPNVTPKGRNPVQWFTWMKDSGVNSGTGPVEDLADLQKLYNIVQNYKIETLARIGNTFVARPSVDFSQAFGAAGGIIFADDPARDIVPQAGNFGELAALDNTLGLVKAEAQLVSGSQVPFQGSASGDYKKTATEISLYQENNISILREIVEHISVAFKATLQQMLELAAREIKEPIVLRVEDKLGQASERVVSFDVVNQGKFSVELTTANPALSKNAQVQSLLQLMQLAQADASGLQVLQPVIEKIAELQGIKDVASLIEEVKYRAAQREQQSAYQGQMQNSV